MGIYCEMNLFKPSDGVYRPGSTVSGIIKYAVDEETKFNRITISLKGDGKCTITHSRPANHHNNNFNNNVHHNNVHNNNITYVMNEIYVDIDQVITRDQDITLPTGAYQTQFAFQLPQHNIPPSFKYNSWVGTYQVNCKIEYYVRIKFGRPGFLKFDKRFKMNIIVGAAIIPRLPMSLTTYSDTKSLTQFFTSKKSVVNLKVNIANSVLTPGEKIMINYELFNDTNIKIKGVKIKLIETLKFVITRGTHEVHTSNSLNDTDSKTASVKSGETQNMNVEIAIPSVVGSIECSSLLSRDYFVEVTVQIPMPHRDMVVHIPVQIGDINDGRVQVVNVVNVIQGNEAQAPPEIESPPSYWEVMGEEKDKS